MSARSNPKYVSVHGGHSAQFCNHARNTLPEVIQAYVEKGFAWVGITEHMPPTNDRFLYPDEQRSGLTAKTLQRRFGQYISAGRSLQSQYNPAFDLYVGFETETYTGSLAYVQQLRQHFAPDYIVGSVHHVDDIGFDYSPALYRKALEHAGGPLGLYTTYFDQQYRMIEELKPEVVGHFDLIRIYDDDYQTRLKHPQILDKIYRNLKLIADLDLILDLNVRAFAKGATEPYPARLILKMAVDMGIAVVTGDDSHGVSTVGQHLDRGIEHLKGLGGSTRWRRPVRP